MKTKKGGLKEKKVKQICLKEKMTASELAREMEETGVMGAGRTGKAVSVLEKMVLDKECKKFFGLAGAMVPGGMKNLVIESLERKWFDVLVCTGANLTHDLVEALGFSHFKGVQYKSDKELCEKGIDRIYDSFMPNDVYAELEKFCFWAFGEMHGNEMSGTEFWQELGKRVPKNHCPSILNTCYENKIPIFCPSPTNSGIGMMLWSYNLSHKGKELKVNVFSDLNEMMDLVWNPENKKQKLGMLIVGGGEPKNYIVQSFQFSPRSAMYAVQITSDRAEFGGSSGAHLNEAISWGKLHEKAEFADVRCDATIALPLIFAALKEKFHGKNI